MSGIVQQFEVRDLNVDMFDEAIGGHRRIVSEVSFRLQAGQGLGITGESGSGKTTLSLALSGLLPEGTRVTAQRFRLAMQNASGLSTRPREFTEAGQLGGKIEQLRGRHIFTLFQEPRASLNPHRTIGWQLERCARRGRRSTVGSRQSAVGSQQSKKHDFGLLTADCRLPTGPSLSSTLASVGLSPDVLSHYPHELSTGMCQRAFLAMAQELGATILVADEPFASVDAETQGRLVNLVRDWMRTRGMILILVSHDLELLRQLTDHSIVLYRGQVAESGPTGDVFGRGIPVHPYTWLLGRVSDRAEHEAVFSPESRQGKLPARCCFASRCAWADPEICSEPLPALTTAAAVRNLPAHGESELHQLRCVRHPLAETQESVAQVRVPIKTLDSPNGQDLLRVTGLAKEFTTGWFRRRTNAVLEDVTFTVREGERLGIMGPSGQGKTTLGRIILGVLPPSRGTIELSGDDGWVNTLNLSPMARTRFRRRVQMLYQDTDLVLDPAARIGDALVEAYQVFDPRLAKRDCYRLSVQMLDELALAANVLEAYPYRLSGGERKRVALARCLAALGCPLVPPPHEPWRLLAMDEPTAGVDVILQAILARFLKWVQSRLRLSYLVISHDEDFVGHFCHHALRLENGHVLQSNSH